MMQKRLSWRSSVFVLFSISLLMTTLLTQLSSADFPTLTPIDPNTALTMTVERANLYASATAVNLACDPAAVFATQTVIAQTATPTPYETPDDLLRTATAVRLHATQTQVALFQDDDLMITATAVRANATATAAVQLGTLPAGTPTLPTLFSVETLITLRARWIAELERAAELSHPVFDDFGDDLVESACAVLKSDYLRENTATIARFSPFPSVDRLSVGAVTYVALIADSNVAYHTDRLLLFRITQEEVLLLLDSAEHREFGRLISFQELYDETVYPGGFADRNGDGRIDLVVDSGDSGSSVWTFEYVILEIEPDGRITNITPNLPNAFFIRGFTDFEPDGILELEVFGCVPHPQNDCIEDTGFNHRRYYGWSGADYIDISHTLDESYYPEISSFFTDVARHSMGCLLPSAFMYETLLAYDAIGQLEAGWARLQPFLRWELCPTVLIEARDDDMNALTDWVAQMLAR